MLSRSVFNSGAFPSEASLASVAIGGKQARAKRVMLLIEVEGSTGVAPQELRKGEFPSEASHTIGGKQARAKRVILAIGNISYCTIDRE